MKKVYTDRNEGGRRSRRRAKLYGTTVRSTRTAEKQARGKPDPTASLTRNDARVQVGSDPAQPGATTSISKRTARKRSRSRARSARRAQAARARAKARRGVTWYAMRVLAVLLALTVLLFGISCMLVIGGSSVGTAVAETQREVKAPSGQRPSPPGLFANAAILVDAESGRVLYEKNPHVQLPIASTTKIMTALVVRDRLKLNDIATISKEAANVGEQSVGLVAGEKIKVEDLLWALLVLSANDAAYALAQQTAGTIPAFADMMNKKAKELGANDSHFMNPHGLDQSGHYSSAYDLSVMGRALLKDPVLAKMVGTKRHSIPMPTGHSGDLTLYGHNEILDVYPGANGIKTGYTGKAGFCLVASATKDEKTLVSVVLNSTHRASDTTALFNYGFASTEKIVFVKAGQKLGTSRVSAFPRRYVSVVAQHDMGALAVMGSGDVYLIRTTVVKQAPGSVKKGTTLGTVQCWINKNPIERGEAVAASTSQKPGLATGASAFLWYSLCWMGRILSAPFRIF